MGVEELPGADGRKCPVLGSRGAGDAQSVSAVVDNVYLVMLYAGTQRSGADCVTVPKIGCLTTFPV